MESISRVPVLPAPTLSGASMWFVDLASKGLAFHPDDDPADIQLISDWSPLFNDLECSELRCILGQLFRELGDRTYDAAYPSFMKAAGFAF
jgi:hypothetical protein